MSDGAATSGAANATDATRARTSFIGMAVFLGGWSMLFAALLFVWADVRLASPTWPPDGEARAPLLWPAVATLLVVGSSWLLARGRLALTVAAGAGFVAAQLAGLAALWRAGVTPSSGRYGSLLYTFLALHGLHVVVGLVGLVVTRARSSTAAPSWRRFWHFVGAVWLVLFAALYLAGCADEHERGRVAYEHYCRACHGDAGDGRGLSSPGLRPPPRDFTAPMFKFGHSPIGTLPPDNELARIIKNGLNGTAMRPLDLSARELADVVAYIKTFSPRWKSEPPGEAIVPSPDPWGEARQAAAVARGASVFTQKGCTGCHNDHRELKQTEYCLRWKPGWKTLDDRECDFVYKELPPDLRCDPLRSIYAGSELSDLYRIIASGIAGAGMPQWKGALPEDELWSLAYYIRSLRRDQTGCSLSRTGQ